jgi:transposase
MVADVKTDIDREMRESELADLRKLGDEISDVKNEFQSAAGKVADDSGVESVVESIKKSADDIQSSVSDVTAADDSAQSAENESPVDDTTDTSQTKDKQIPTP